MSDILAEMRGVLAGHAEECGARAPQMMIDSRLYPDEIEDWATEVERLRRIEVAAREVVTEWRRETDWYRPDFEVLIDGLDQALVQAG
jgi:hypothetical protein